MEGGEARNNADGADKDMSRKEGFEVYEAEGVGSQVEDLRWCQWVCVGTGKETYTCGVTRKVPKWMALSIFNGIVSSNKLSCNWRKG